MWLDVPASGYIIYILSGCYKKSLCWCCNHPPRCRLLHCSPVPILQPDICPLWFWGTNTSFPILAPIFSPLKSPSKNTQKYRSMAAATASLVPYHCSPSPVSQENSASYIIALFFPTRFLVGLLRLHPHLCREAFAAETRAVTISPPACPNLLQSHLLH